MEKVQVKLLVEGASYGEVTKAAKALGLPHVGRKIIDIIESVNAKINEMVEAGEAELIAQDQEIVNETPNVENTPKVEDAPKADKTPKTPKAATTPKEKKVKEDAWHANGYGYQPQDEITIIGQHIVKGGVAKVILQGRKAVIVGPSRTKDKVQAYLINDKTGERQGCLITLGLNEIKPFGTVDATDENAQQEQVETQNEEQVVTQVELQSEEQNETQGEEQVGIQNEDQAV